MAVISISVREYGPWFTSGIPRGVALSTNVPAIIYYTLDGSEPNTASSVYVNNIIFPSSMSVHLRALAISGSDRGTLNLIFFSNTEKLYFPRRSDYLGGMGVVVDGYNTENVLYDGYGADAYGELDVVVRSSDYELNDLEIKYSNEGGYYIGPNFFIKMGIPPEEFWQDNAIDPVASSPNNNNVYFNPRSLYIILDGRDAYDGYLDQSVYPINRPHGSTMNVVKYLQGKTLIQKNSYVSGGFVRSFRNATNRTSVSYYFDSNETRWIKSIQNFVPEDYPQNLGNRNSTGKPLVFKWIYNKRSMF
jgi:hypothetical protein